MTEAPSQYSAKVPGLQLVWDSTSLSMLKTCPTKYLYGMVQGYRAIGTRAPLTFGQLIHKGLERYDVALALGETHDQAVESSLWQTLHEAGEREQIPVCPGCATFLQDLPDGNQYCPACDQLWGGEWKSHYSEADKPRSVESLARTLIWYWEHFRDDPAKTVILANGKPAVELSFRFELGLEAITGEPYFLSGHFDRIVDFADQRWVQDRKHTASSLSSFFFDKFTPDNQMSCYSVASQVVFASPVRGVMIDGIQIGVNFSRFRRGFANRSPAQLSEWLAETKAWIKMAESYAVGGWYPRNDTACHHYHKADGTGGCDFRTICGRDPSVRDNFLATEFRKEFWNPLETR